MNGSALDATSKQPGAKEVARKRTALRVGAALAALVALALLSVDFLARVHPDFLRRRAEEALGRKLSVGRIELSFFPPGARLSDLSIADDPAFSAGDFLSAKNVTIELRLLPLFLGRLRAARIALDAPTVAIVRDARGRYNFSGSERERKEPGRKRGNGAAPSSEAREIWLPPAPAMEISNGTLRFRDLTEAGELVATRIDLTLDGFDVEEPFELQFEAALAADRPNLRLKSRIGPIAGLHDYRDVPIAGELNAVDLDVGKINRAAPKLKKALPRALRFDGVYTIQELRFSGTLNRLSLKGAVTGTDASFRFE